MTDILLPFSYSGQEGAVVQIDATESGLEFGQPLRITDSPEFVELELTGDLLVGGDLFVEGDVVQLAVGTLFVGDNNIEIGDVDIPTDLTADGGGLTLHGDTDKTILWLNSIDAWSFNQDIDVFGNIIVSGLVDGVNVAIDAAINTAHRSSSGDSHTFIGQDVRSTASPTFNNLTVAGNFTVLGNTVTLETQTLIVEDKAIELGKVAIPSDITADGGGIILKADNDISILWLNATNAWTFNRDIDLILNNLNSIGSVNVSNLKLNGNTLSATLGDLILTAIGTVDITGALKISSGNPGAGKVLQSDANGIATWETTDLTAAGGWTDDGAVVRLTDITDKVGIGTASPGAKLEISGQIKITGGNPGNSKFLRSDANGLATWGDVGWTDLGTDVVLLDSSNNVGIGISNPDTKLHVTDGGSAGAVTAFSGTIATLESPGDGYLSILTPDAGIRGILFGEPSSNAAGGIFYNDPGSLDGFQFRVNGNVTKMVIEGDGKVGIGTTNPDFTSILDLSSTTKGFLPPRMTTAQRDDISSPLAGLKIHNTTVDKSEVFTGTSWKTVLTEDLGNVIAQETFASTNVRFFGELALPTAQGWTDIATGIATIDLVTQTVFGEVKQVVRHNDDTTGGSTTSQITLTSQNWTDINAFGASYSGTARLDTVNGASGFFSGLQVNTAENPLATGNRRYGVLFDNIAGNLRVFEADNTGNSVIMDGTGGNPLITFDEWFNWECVVPAGLGAAEFYINGILTTFVPVFGVNGGGLGTRVLVSSGSTGGANRIAYHDNFGVTIFEESSTKTLTANTMAGDVAQINIPEGKRDYTIILPDGNPRAIGSELRLVANNLGGSVELQNENSAVPEILYNGLRTLVLEIAVKEVINGVNTVNSGNVYIGFKAEDVDRAKSIFAQLHSIIDQIPTNTNPIVITYTNHDAINGIGHSTTINTGELEILSGFGGTYFIMAQPQVGKTQGATGVDFDMFLQVDRSSGFVDEPNSNIKLTIKDQDITDVIVSAFSIQLNVGDKIRMMQKVSDSSVGMGLKNTDPVVGPPTIPRTPSIIFTMYRIGG